MGERTDIQWCHHTYSPWQGCTKVSPGCDHCYAEGWAKRSGLVEWGGPRRRASPDYLNRPLKWNRKAERDGVRRRVFPSLMDPFDNQVPGAWRCDLWDIIWQTPWLDWLLLTKRPQNIASMLPTKAAGALADWGNGWSNVWLGTTAENQEEAERRIPHLLRVPAVVRFLSCEPLLGPVNLRCIPWRSDRGYADALTGKTQHSETRARDPDRYPDTGAIDWVICGGESGGGARPMHPDWAKSLRDQCTATGVPFFFKQWGEWKPAGEMTEDEIDWCYRPPLSVSASRRRVVVPACHFTRTGEMYDFSRQLSASIIVNDPRRMFRVGVKQAGALLSGQEWLQIPIQDEGHPVQSTAQTTASVMP